MSVEGASPDAEPFAFLRSLFNTAVAAAAPGPAVSAALLSPPAGRVLVLAIGKAAGPMAAAVEAAWGERLGPLRLSGLAVTPDGHDLPLQFLEGVAAAHPIPDSRSEQAARRCLREAATLGPDDLLLMLLSGGGSALVAAPAPGLTLADKAETTQALLRAGLPIAAINRVRRRLSAIKGGRLAIAAAPARVVNLIVSDVPGDDPALVASGPTIPDQSPAPNIPLALLPEPARRALAAAEAPPAPGDPRLPSTETRIVLRAADALAAAAASARAAGCRVLDLGEVEAPAAALGAEHAARVLALLESRRRDASPLLLLSGGETSVGVTGSGRGGRNTAYLLALAMELGGAPGVHALAADTDGIDGRGGHAGARLGPGSLEAWRSLGLDPAACLQQNDSRTPFERSGDLIVTGPTRTNVNDFRAILLTG